MSIDMYRLLKDVKKNNGNKEKRKSGKIKWDAKNKTMIEKKKSLFQKQA